MTGLAAAPVSTSAADADWAAATDVTPEHIGQRTGADKALAALSAARRPSSTRTKALLKNEKQLDDVTVAPAAQAAAAAAENPGTIPDGRREAGRARGRQSSILDGYTFCLQPKGRDALRQADHRQRDRRHPAQVARPQRAAADLDGVEGDRPAAASRA